MWKLVKHDFIRSHCYAWKITVLLILLLYSMLTVLRFQTTELTKSIYGISILILSLPMFAIYAVFMNELPKRYMKDSIVNIAPISSHVKAFEPCFVTCIYDIYVIVTCGIIYHFYFRNIDVFAIQDIIPIKGGVFELVSIMGVFSIAFTNFTISILCIVTTFLKHIAIFKFKKDNIAAILSILCFFIFEQAFHSLTPKYLIMLCFSFVLFFIGYCLQTRQKERE